MQIPFDRSYWVVPHLLLAGCYPSSFNQQEKREKLKNLLQIGVRCFVNLTEEEEDVKRSSGEVSMFYRPKLLAMVQTQGLEVSYVRFPIFDGDVPNQLTMCSILNFIDQAMENKQAVYVHCLAGRGRTGTVVGCFLARHGIASGQAVFDKLREFSQTSYPQSEAQRTMVSAWQVGK